MSMNGVSSNWRTTTPFRRVLVEASNQYTCDVVDLATGTPQSVQSITPSREIPRPGDIWIISNDTGQWTFHRVIDAISNETSIPTELGIRLEEVRRRSYQWQPFDNPRNGAVEVPQGAYIGQRALFETQPSERWLPINGAAVSRHRWRALFELIGISYGPGDGVNTFNLPSQADVSADMGLLSDTYLAATGVSDYVVTNTHATIPGLQWTFTIPSSPASYILDVTAAVAISTIYLGGNPDSEAILRLNGTNYVDTGFTHSMEWQPTANDPMAVRNGQWKVLFSTTGLQTVDITIAKSDTTGTVNVIRKNTSMQARLYRAGGSVAGSGPAQWYICAE